MKPFPLLATAAVLLAFSGGVRGQGRSAVEFQITKITKNLISSPQFTYNGAHPYEPNLRDRWLEVEVEFAAAPAWTDELTAKYFVLVNGKLLTGEVTHVQIPAGRELRSVMYVTPRALDEVMAHQPVTASAIKNVAVQLLTGGAVKSEASLERARPGWFTALPAVNGFLLNKDETPFAPLYWDRYERIKSR